jgi:putative inorganic carbon (HCO3(-)) transporter
LIACLVLASPLIFADLLPRGVVIFLFVALLGVFAARAALTRTVLPRTAVDWPNVLALVLLPVALWASADPAASWPAVAKVVAGLALFYGFAGLAGTKWMRLLPWLLLVFALGVWLVVVLTTRWTPSKIPVLPVSLYSLLPKIRLPFDVNGIHPNLAGHLMALLLLPAVALALWTPYRPVRWTAVVVAVLLGVVLLLSQSRGAWIAAAVALALMPWLRYRRWWMVVLALAVIVVVVSLLLGPARLEAMVFPVAADDDVTINTLPGRLEIWTRAIVLLRDFGLTGGGAGNFEQVLMTLYPPFFTGVVGGFGHAHNVYLQMAVDFGVPGLIVFLALLLGLAAGLVAAAHLGKAQPVEGAVTSLAIGLFGSLLVVAIHGLVDAPLATPRVYAVVFLLFGMGAAASSHLAGLAGQPRAAASAAGGDDRP